MDSAGELTPAPIGAIIGDIVGSRFEFDNHRDKDFRLFTAECFPTDDSIMTMAVARALREVIDARGDAVPRDDPGLLADLRVATIRWMREAGRRYPDCGFGGRFFDWIFSANPRPYNSFGNGAAMRVSAVGFAARSEAEVAALSRAVTDVTHDHPEGVKGAEATAMAIFLARRGATQEEIRSRISADYYPLDFTVDQIRPTYAFNETCQDTVPQAITCFLESESFEDCLRTSISLGGDSDTVAAIACSIAEAHFGVPDALRQTALGYLDDYLLELYRTG